MNETPMVSAETQQLLDVARAITVGASDRWPELEALAQQRHRGATQKHGEYVRQTEQQTPDFRALQHQIIETLDSGFQNYEQALEQMLSAGVAKDAGQLREASESLLDAALTLGPAVSAFQDACFTSGAAAGSRFRSVAFFEGLTSAYRSGEVSEETWKQTCAYHAQYYANGATMIGNPPPADLAGVAEQHRGFELMRDSIHELEALKPSDIASKFDAALARLSQGAGAVESGVTTEVETLAGAGPTVAPAANMVINATEGLMRKKLEPHTLETVASDYLRSIRIQIVDIDNVLAADLEKTALIEELPRARAALAMMSACLRELIEYAQGEPKEIDALDNLLGDFEDAVSQLAESDKVMKQFAETVGKVMCPYCSAYNPSTNRKCDACNRALPQRVGLDGHGAELSSLQVLEGGQRPEEAGPVMTQSMKRVFEACDGFFKGTVTREAALAVITELDEKIGKADAGYRPIQLPDFSQMNYGPSEREAAVEAQQVAQEASGMLRAGLDGCLQGLRAMRSSVETEDQALLRTGASSYYEGMQLLFAVKHLDESLSARIAAFEQGETTPTPPASEDEPTPEEEEVAEQEYSDDLA